MPAHILDVLLVEDNQSDRELFQLAWKKAEISQSYKVDFAINGAEALDLIFSIGFCDEYKPGDGLKLIITDVKMPKMDGIEFARRLKADHLTKDIPVVVFSSSFEPNDVKAAYEAGVSSFVVKPIEFNSFTQAVQEIGNYWLLRNKPPR